MKALSKRYFRGWHAALVCLLTLAGLTVPALRNHAQGPTSYTITDLGTLGGAQSKAFGINDCGSVVGSAFTTSSPTPNPFFRSHGQATLTDIGTLGFDGTATAINASNFVVGNSATSGGLRGFIWRDNNGNGASDVGELVDLGTLPGDTDVAAWDINDAGRVVGGSEAALVPRAFVWQQGVMQEIAAVNGIDPTVANGINNAGQIVGVAFVASVSQSHAFFLDGSVMIELGTLGGKTSIAREVNEAGYVVGMTFMNMDAGPPFHAFIWSNDGNGMKDLGTLGGTNSEAYDINASGQVVGTADVALPTPSPSPSPSPSPTPDARRAFVWEDDGDGNPEPGEMKDLNTLIPAADAANWTLLEARSINDGGQIVGFGTKSTGEIHAFLLTPTGFTPPSCSTPPPSPTPTPSPTVTVAVSPSSVSEDGATNLAYTFTRTGSTASALTVNFSVAGGANPATFGTDYSQTGAATFSSTSGTVTFGAGDSTATVTLDPAADTTVEPDETVILTVTSGSGYNVGSPSAATGTITNDDTNVSVSVAPASVFEDGVTNLVYTFTRVGVTSGTLTVNFSVGGTAAFSTDYAQTGAATFGATSGTVTFGAGSPTATVTLNPETDSTVEPDETAILTVTTGTSYTVGTPSAATGTITNDDTEVSVAVSPLSVTEDGVTNLVYTFTRVGVTSGTLTVNFSVGGTAAFSTDYAQTGAATFGATSGTVTFGAGSPTATVTLNPETDTTVEPDETAILTVTSGTGYTVGTPSAATGTITNDDTEVSVAVSPLSVTEDGVTNLVYTFTRTGSTTNSFTVNFSVTGDATSGTDYTISSSNSITINAGSATATVTVDPTADTTVESSETVILTVTSGSYTIGSSNAATGTITNDDSEVSVAVSPSSVTEDGATNLVYTFTRTGDTSGPVTVSFSVGGTATFGTDYSQSGAASFSSTSGTVTFAAGSSTATVTIDPNADATDEASKSVTLTVTSGTGYNVGSTPAATGSITVTAPTLFTEDGVNALAIDSVTFVRAPFRVIGTHNFSTDQRTRIMLFTSSLGLTQPDSQKLTVQAMGFDLPVEAVGPLNGVPGYSYIIVKLPDNLITGNLPLTVTLYGVSSNSALLSIVP